MRILVLAIALGAMVTGCQTWRDRANIDQGQHSTQPVPSDVKAAADMDAAYVRKVQFDAGSTSLSASAQQDIRKAISDVQADGRRIDDVKVVVWGDQSYPARDAASLSKEQVDLAKERGEKVSRFLKDDLAIGDVDVYNMAERPNTFERWFNTSDAKIKNALERSGLVRNGALVRNDRSQAYLMITLKN